MKWYAKQLKALRKDTEGTPASQKKSAAAGISYSDKNKVGRNTYSSPVSQRNRNRPKTDQP